jgi:hypothetical protein
VDVSITLTITEKIDFDLLIEDIQDEDLANTCGCPADEERKFTKSAKKIKKHLSKHGSVKHKIHYKSFGQGWGHWRDLVSTAVQVSADNAPAVLQLNNQSACMLSDAIRNATAGNATLQPIVDDLIAQIHKILNMTNWSKGQKWGKLHKLFNSFFKNNTNLEDSFEDIDIGGCCGQGKLGSFRDLFKVGHQSSRLVKVIGGKDDTNSELLKKLTIAASNISINVTIRTQILQLHDIFTACFQRTGFIDERIQNVSEEINLCLKLSPWVTQDLMDIELEDDEGEEACGCTDGKWGDIYDLVFTSHIASEDSENATDATLELNDGEAMGPCNCAKRPDVILKNTVNGNQSYLEFAIDQVINDWPDNLKLSYLSTKNQVRTIILGTVDTVPVKINKIITAFKNYNKGSGTPPVQTQKQKKTQEFSFSIPLPHVSFEGKIRDFIQCGSA